MLSESSYIFDTPWCETYDKKERKKLNNINAHSNESILYTKYAWMEYIRCYSRLPMARQRQPKPFGYLHFIFFLVVVVFRFILRHNTVLCASKQEITPHTWFNHNRRGFNMLFEIWCVSIFFWRSRESSHSADSIHLKWRHKGQFPFARLNGRRISMNGHSRLNYLLNLFKHAF